MGSWRTSLVDWLPPPPKLSWPLGWLADCQPASQPPASSPANQSLSPGHQDGPPGFFFFFRETFFLGGQPANPPSRSSRSPFGHESVRTLTKWGPGNRLGRTCPIAFFIFLLFSRKACRVWGLGSPAQQLASQEVRQREIGRASCRERV